MILGLRIDIIDYLLQLRLNIACCANIHGNYHGGTAIPRKVSMPISLQKANVRSIIACPCGASAILSVLVHATRRVQTELKSIGNITYAYTVNFNCVEKLRLRFACVRHFAYTILLCHGHGSRRATSTKSRIRAQANTSTTRKTQTQFLNATEIHCKPQYIP